MARRPPGNVRAGLSRRRRPGERITLIDGVSARGLARIARLERTSLCPGAAAAALTAWREFARASGDERADMLFYGHAGCCPDPRDHREILERVVRVLPRRDAAALRRRVEALDEAVIRTGRAEDSWPAC